MCFVNNDTSSRNAIVNVEEGRTEFPNICSRGDTAEVPEMKSKQGNNLEESSTGLHSNGTSYLANKGVEVAGSTGSTGDCVDDRKFVDASDLHEEPVEESAMEVTLEKILFSRINSKIGIDSNHRNCKDPEPTSVIESPCASPGDPTPPSPSPYQQEQTDGSGKGNRSLVPFSRMVYTRLPTGENRFPSRESSPETKPAFHSKQREQFHSRQGRL